MRIDNLVAQLRAEQRAIQSVLLCRREELVIRMHAARFATKAEHIHHFRLFQQNGIDEGYTLDGLQFAVVLFLACHFRQFLGCGRRRSLGSPSALGRSAQRQEDEKCEYK